MIFCPIRGQQAVKSFRVFLHGNHLVAILNWFVWQGFAQGEKSQSQAQNVQEIVRNIGGKIRWIFRRYRNSSVFPRVRDLFKDVLPDSPKIAVINLDKEKVAQYFSLGKQNRTAKNQPLLNELMYYLIFPTERRKQHILSIVQVRT